MQARMSPTYSIAAAAIMTAIVAVFTYVIQVRNPASGGYFNLSDVAVIFSAITFGPWIGLVSAGLVGVVWMMLAYLVGEGVFFAWSDAIADLLGSNWIQALAGLLGIALYFAVRAAYPPIGELRLGRTWKEI